jgi:hypothetical protein
MRDAPPADGALVGLDDALHNAIPAEDVSAGAGRAILNRRQAQRTTGAAGYGNIARLKKAVSQRKK